MLWPRAGSDRGWAVHGGGRLVVPGLRGDTLLGRGEFCSPQVRTRVAKDWGSLRCAASQRCMLAKVRGLEKKGVGVDGDRQEICLDRGRRA